MVLSLVANGSIVISSLFKISGIISDSNKFEVLTPSLLYHKQITPKIECLYLQRFRLSGKNNLSLSLIIAQTH